MLFLITKADSLMCKIDEAIFRLIEPQKNTKVAKLSKSLILQFDNALQKVIQRYFVKDEEVNKKFLIEICALFFAVLSLIIAAIQNSSPLLLIVDLFAAILSFFVIFV